MTLDEAGARDVVLECLGEVLAEVNASAEERDRTASPLPVSVLARAGASGLLALAAPREAGGQGGDVRSWGRIVQQIGRQCQDLAFPGLLNVSLSVITRLAETGRADLIEEYAVPIMRGERFCGVAYSEDSDPFAMRTALVRDGDGYRMAGRKVFVTGGLHADLFLVYAVDEAGDMIECLVRREDPGVEVAQVLTTGLRTLGGAALILDAVPLERGRILAGSDGLLDAQQGLTLRRLLHCGPPLGRAQDVFDITLARLAATERYGQRLADMPNVQAIVGQMYIALQAAQALYHGALDRWDAGQAEPGFDPVISAAKHFVVEQARFVLDRSLRVLGGYPCLEDLRFGRYLRDFAALIPAAGTQDLLEVTLGAMAAAQVTS